jgi:tripartite-type tricarboxylate transporter receptor subunit TctC
MQSVVKAPPDGYTLVLGTGSTVTVNQFLSKLPYDPINDLEPVSLIVMSPILLSANAAQPFRTIQELVQYARANPGRLNFGSDGQGSFTHLVGEMFKKAARIEMTHVPYKGTADSMNAVIAGDIQLVVGGVSGALLAQREIKRLNVLAVAGAQRIASLPDVPTLDESGLTGFEATSWYGILAPVGTDPAIRRRISQEIFRITARPDIIARIAASGQQPQASTPEAMRQRIKAESERWSALIRELNIKVD